MLHKHFVIPYSVFIENTELDFCKAVQSSNVAKTSLFPQMRMASTDGLVAYEYGIREDISQRRNITDVSQETWDAFAKDFCAYVQATGLQDIISVANKFLRVTGGE